MESFIHEHKSSNKNNKLNCYYGSIKTYDFIDKDNNPRIKDEEDVRVLAKIKVKNDDVPKYLLRVNNFKKIYDPSSDLSENKTSENLFQENKDSINFKEVNKKTFDFYLSFLRTMNTSWIRNAEREDF